MTAAEFIPAIYTDGGCSGNPGPGGWAYVIVRCPGGDKSGEGTVLAEQWGSEKNTTNNRMELLAVISALRALKSASFPPDCSARRAAVHTDSQYVQKGITEWILNWKRNGWRTRDKKPVKNQDLWIELDRLAGELTLEWVWVKGHAGDRYNERCDKMTQEAIQQINRE